MSDMNAVIQPKTDQLNSDSLITGPITITIRDVHIRPGTEQPISVFYNGDDGKPWKPCKTTARIMVNAWGPDSKAYVGRSLTLYRDPKVRWGGVDVGGIRISHMSHIDKDMTMALAESKSVRKPVTIKPLRIFASKRDESPWPAEADKRISEATDPAALTDWWEGEAQAERSALYAANKGRYGQIKAAFDGKIAELSA